jgi:hypothetical protein
LSKRCFFSRAVMPVPTGTIIVTDICMQLLGTYKYPTPWSIQSLDSLNHFIPKHVITHSTLPRASGLQKRRSTATRRTEEIGNGWTCPRLCIASSSSRGWNQHTCTVRGARPVVRPRQRTATSVGNGHRQRPSWCCGTATLSANVRRRSSERGCQGTPAPEPAVPSNAAA